MIQVSALVVPVLATLPLGVLVVILRYLDPQGLFNAIRAWKPFMVACRNDQVLSERVRSYVKKQNKSKIESQNIKPANLYHQTPLLRQRDRDQFKIPKMRLYRAILEEEKRRGGEVSKISKSSRYQPYSKNKGLRI